MPKHDDIPPIEVIEAAARRDREQAAELLAGFDRPGRRPRRSRREDFVAHYARRGAEKIDPAPDEPARRDSTFRVPRKKPIARLVPWVAVASVTAATLGGLVALVATWERAPRAAPSSATTISAAQNFPARANEVPAPPPTASVGTPPADTARAKPPALRQPTKARPAQRDDFLRDL